MSRIIHFEIHTAEPRRAAKFYTGVFGWKIKKWKGPQDYWLITTGSHKKLGIDGGLMKRPKGKSMTAYVCTIHVTSVDEFVKKIAAKGGSIVAPKMAIPGVGWLAYCKDTEGNIFGIMQTDEKAK